MEGSQGWRSSVPVSSLPMLDTDRRVGHDLTAVLLLPLTAGEPACLPACQRTAGGLGFQGVWVSGPVAKETPASDLRGALAHVLSGPPLPFRVPA